MIVLLNLYWGDLYWGDLYWGIWTKMLGRDESLLVPHMRHHLIWASFGSCGFLPTKNSMVSITFMRADTLSLQFCWPFSLTPFSAAKSDSRMLWSWLHIPQIHSQSSCTVSIMVPIKEYCTISHYSVYLMKLDSDCYPFNISYMKQLLFNPININTETKINSSWYRKKCW